MKACYRELHGYKYQLMDDYTIRIDIKPAQSIEFKFLALSPEGLLTIRKYYAWDGPSGPTIDSRDFMRGSLIHDALYQLMRLSALDHRVYRKRADEILKEVCREDGMNPFRAWYVYLAVHLFASGSARPREEPKAEIICSP
ncbi:MAG: DUF1353 domain-containing protein [Chloroflexota bacterium]